MINTGTMVGKRSQSGKAIARKGDSSMGKDLNPGNAGFQSIRKGTYIDKTEMIDYINHTLGTKIWRRNSFGGH